MADGEHHDSQPRRRRQDSAACAGGGQWPLHREEKARQSCANVVGRKLSSRNQTTIIRSHFGPANGVELPPREPGREPLSFD